MKKGLVCLIIAAMAASLMAGCGTKKAEDLEISTSQESSSVEENPDELSVEPEETAVQEEVWTPEVGTAVAEIPEKELPDDLFVRTYADTQRQNATDQCFAEVKYDYIEVMWDDLDEEYNAKYENLNNALSAFNENNYEDSIIRLEELRKDVEGYLLECGTEGTVYGQSSLKTIEVLRTTEGVLSFWERTSEYTGGAHGNVNAIGHTFDSKTGKELTFERIVVNYPKIKNAVLQAVKELDDYEDIKEYMSGDAGVKAYIDEQINNKELKWALGTDGFYVYFAPYELAPYALGEHIVVVPYAKNGGIFNKQYVDPKDAFDSQLPVTGNEIVRLPKMVSEDKTTATFGNPYAEGEYWAYMIMDTENEWGDYDLIAGFGDRVLYAHDGYTCFDADVFVANNEAEGGALLCMNILAENDWTSCVTVNGAGQVHNNDFALAVKESASSDEAPVEKRIYTLSTFGVEGTVCMFNGRLTESTDMMKIRDEITLTLLQDTYAYVDQYTTDAIDVTAGTKLVPVADNGSGCIQMRMEDGTEVYFYYYDNREEYYTSVNGIDIDELFEGMVFAG